MKKLPGNVDIKEVHHLTNIPGVEAKLPRLNPFKPFNFIAMTSLILLIISGILYWQLSPKTDRGSSYPLMPDSPYDVQHQDSDQEKRLDTEIALQKGKQKELQTNALEQLEKNKKSPRSSQNLPPVPLPDRVQQDMTAPIHSLPFTSIQNTACSWPVDTLLKGEPFVLNLSREELKKLGFEFKDYGIYYKNKHQGVGSTYHEFMKEGSGSARYLSSNTDERNEKLAYSSFDFYPVFMTDHFFRPTSALGGDIAQFELTRDTLIPIRINPAILPEVLYESRTFWLIPTPSLFDALPPQYAYLKETMDCIQKLREKTGRTDIVHYKAEQLIKSAEFLSLDRKTLESIGFRFSAEGVRYSENTKMGSLEVYTNSQADGVTLNLDTTLTPTPFRLIFLSDQLGYQRVKWTFSEPARKKFKLNYFKNLHELLVPIRLEVKDYPEILAEDRIFWFELTDALLNVLPESIRSQLEKEYNYIISDDKEGLETDCTFFEACRATLHVHDLTLAPNPATHEVKLQFSLPARINGKIVLTAMSGIEFKSLVPFGSFAPGINAYDLDVSDVPAGIYLVSIITDKGFKTRRLIVRH